MVEAPVLPTYINGRTITSSIFTNFSYVNYNTIVHPYITSVKSAMPVVLLQSLQKSPAAPLIRLRGRVDIQSSLNKNYALHTLWKDQFLREKNVGISYWRLEEYQRVSQFSSGR